MIEVEIALALKGQVLVENNRRRLPSLLESFAVETQDVTVALNDQKLVAIGDQPGS